VVFVVGVTAGEKDEDESDCDLAKVVKMHHCDLDEVVLEKDQLVSDEKYLVCEECSAIAGKKGECAECEGKVVEKVSGKDACPLCFGKVELIDVCVKVYYECPGCDAQATKAGQCAPCKKDLVKKTHRSPIEYWCEECGMSARKPGKCTEKTCKAKGTALTRTCEDSGDFPHVGSKGK
jgi:hypothetical protein